MDTTTMLMVGYLLVINIYGYAVMAIDKQKAIRHRWRIPERHLWVASWIGGAWGVFIGMRLKRHKTKHLLFQIGVPLLCVGHFILWGYLFVRLWQ